MANLRGLLGKEYASTLPDAVAKYGSFSKVRDGKVHNFASYCNMHNCDDSYRHYYMQYYCVPCGTTQITWELWGGGGSGAGACCCQQGAPGGSGAYARKTLTYPQIQGGWCYHMQVGGSTCCSQCCHGIRGCKTYVCGCNLNNFCAEGGLGGKTCCFAYWDTTYRCQPRIDWGGDKTEGSKLDGTAPTTDGYGAYNRVNDCSCYFGADCGLPGRMGYFNQYCTQNNCYVKIALPYQGKLIDDMGGHITVNNKGNACINEGGYCSGTTPWAFNSNCNGGPGMPGVGAPSSTSCGGSCCYGMRGVGGFIKVTFCSCWIGVDNSCAHYFCN